MTDAAAATGDLALKGESFWWTLLRRARYVVAILISGYAFLWVGWPFAAPPSTVSGVSLMAWSSGSGIVASLMIALLLIAVSLVCTALVHPDAPHMGLFCALVGMAALSIKGGTSHMLIQFAQMSDTYSTVMERLAIECVQWAILLLIAEAVVRMAHDRFLANTHWITRTGADFAQKAASHSSAVQGAMGVSLMVSEALKTRNLQRRIATPLAMLYSGLVGYALLFALMQSPLKGQVFFACATAFLASTVLAYLAFPRVPAVAYLLVVPITAGVAFFLARHQPGIYPGHGGSFISRSLPIDFIVAGVPGSILGYYWALHWSLQSHDPSAS